YERVRRPNGGGGPRLPAPRVARCRRGDRDAAAVRPAAAALRQSRALRGGRPQSFRARSRRLLPRYAAGPHRVDGVPGAGRLTETPRAGRGRREVGGLAGLEPALRQELGAYIRRLRRDRGWTL